MCRSFWPQAILRLNATRLQWGMPNLPLRISRCAEHWPGSRRGGFGILIATASLAPMIAVGSWIPLSASSKLILPPLSYSESISGCCSMEGWEIKYTLATRF